MSSVSSSASQEPIKRRRITRACDRCHRSGVKCSSTNDPSVCGPCLAFGSECTYDRPIKKRGPVPRTQWASKSAPSSREAWAYEAIGSAEAIDVLVDAYHRIVYPMLPYFHWPTFTTDIRARRYIHDRAFFAVTMAVCAAAAARLRDGAGVLSVTLPRNTPPSEAFYDAAMRAFPSDLSQAHEFDYKRAKGILAILCVQYGQVKQTFTHLGDFATLCGNDGFHDETRWPPNLTEIDKQERRRTFWGVYTIDIYSSTTWGGIPRHRESQVNIQYPANVYDDDEITETGIVRRPPGSPSASRVSWLVGWSFTTSLYRILEHALDQLHLSRVEPVDTSGVNALYHSRKGPTPDEILGVVAQMYADLPVEFKVAKAMSGNLEEDRFGFQAADIIVLMQTIKMVVTGTEETSVEKRCAIAGELLDALSTVPTSYLQAISSPMLHHLAAVGHLLGRVIQSPLSLSSYFQVRTVLLAMADLLSSLESTLSFVPGIAEKLRAHVLRIDQYMETEAEDRARRLQVYHNGLPKSVWSMSTLNAGSGSGSGSGRGSASGPLSTKHSNVRGTLRSPSQSHRINAIHSPSEPQNNPLHSPPLHSPSTLPRPQLTAPSVPNQQPLHSPDSAVHAWAAASGTPTLPQTTGADYDPSFANMVDLDALTDPSGAQIMLPEDLQHVHWEELLGLEPVDFLGSTFYRW